MNERIKELAKQSLPAYYLTNCPSALEKFAELIVNECIDYCGENLSRTVGGALKIHFGVNND
jgi:hypothetical protein